VVCGQSDRVATGSDEAIQTGEQFTERSIEPDKDVLNLMAVGTVIVANFVERRETDANEIGRSRSV
jgi:hypothetical protein